MSDYKKLLLIADSHVWSNERNARVAQLRPGVPNPRGALGTYMRARELNHICNSIVSRYNPGQYTVLIAGDVVEGGNVASTREQEYRNAREALQPLVSRRFEVHMVPGNHDYGPFGNFFVEDARRRFLAMAQSVCGYPARFDYPHRVNFRAWQLVLLNSNAHVRQRATFARGRIGERQLSWLSSVLSSASVPTVIAMHHHARVRHIGHGAREIVDREEFEHAISPARQRGQRIILCCGHKHVEDLTFIATGKCTDNLRVLELDPARDSSARGVSLQVGSPAGSRGSSGATDAEVADPEVRMRRARNSSREDSIFNNRSLANDCTVKAVALQRLDHRLKPVGQPQRKITLAPAEIAGAMVVEDGVGTNSLRVKVRTWNGAAVHLRYRIVYTIQSRAGVVCAV